MGLVVNTKGSLAFGIKCKTVFHFDPHHCVFLMGLFCPNSAGLCKF